MFHEALLLRDRQVGIPWTHPDHSRYVNREEILRVLAQAAEDSSFIAQLTYQGSEVLQGYDLTWQEKAALLSGDIDWLEAHVGKLDARLRTWPECRLQQEKW